ncbi:hypothetical protein D049_2456B, partial [Vibrio parahaemolyticus VPTS-2010]
SAEVNAISLRIASLDLEAPFLCLLADHSSLYQQERRLQQESEANLLQRYLVEFQEQ